MAKYSDIKGSTVQTLSTDPVASQFAGGAWASGGTIPQGVSSGMGFGTQTASVIGGGNAGPDYSNNVYEYDGSSWTAGGSLTASAGQARTGHGVLTAGGAVAGYKTSGNAVINNYEQYDGSSFTEQNDLNTARQTLAAAGSTTAALAVGGTTGVGPGSTQTGLTNVESYNGSSWTETTENNTGRKQATSFSGGPAPTMIFIGGASGGTFYANTETYNGSAWTETTDLNTARSAFGGAGQAQTDGLVFGGSVPANTAVTEQWNGTTWTELSDLSTARNSLVGSGTGAAAALAAGGYSTTVETATEEFTAPATFNQLTEGQLFFNSTANAFKETVTDIPGATWASGGAMNTTRAKVATTQNGTQSAAQVAGGVPGPGGVNTEQYNGSTWTEVNNLNAANGLQGGTGTQTSAISFGGYTSTWLTNVETWDGTNWTETTEVNVGRNQGGSGGSSSSSALYFAGEGPGSPPPQLANTETWNGSSWTEVNNMNAGRVMCYGCGPISDALATGGATDGNGTTTANTELWDGTSWTEVNNLNTSRMGMGVAGASGSSALAFGGTVYPGNTSQDVTEIWNGTSWTEIADLSTARYDGNGNGTAFGALYSGGGTSASGSTTTEEWTADLANKTITAS